MNAGSPERLCCRSRDHYWPAPQRLRQSCCLPDRRLLRSPLSDWHNTTQLLPLRVDTRCRLNILRKPWLSSAEMTTQITLVIDARC